MPADRFAVTETLLAFAISPCTTILLVKLAKLAVTRLPKLAFNDVMLPLKLAVLPSNCKLTVRLLVVVLLETLTKLAVAKLPRFAFNVTMLPEKFAVLPASAKLTVKLLVIVLLETLAKFAMARFPRLALLNCAFPLTVNKLVA